MAKNYKSKKIKVLCVFSVFCIGLFGINTYSEDVKTTPSPVETLYTQEETGYMNDTQETYPDTKLDEEDNGQNDASRDIDAEEYLNSFRVVSSNDRLTLYAEIESGEVAVYDSQTDEYWFSNPPNRDQDTLATGFNRVLLQSQIRITYSTERGTLLERGSSLHSVARGGLSHEIRGDSIVFFYDFIQDDITLITVPVEFSIGGDYFGARIITEEIFEYEDHNLINVDLLPYFAAGYLTDEGYMLIPDGTGALIHMNNGKISAVDYSAPVYGVNDKIGAIRNPPSDAWRRTITAREAIRLPVFGMKRNDVGYLAVITSAEARGTIKATVSGRGTNFNSVNAQLNYTMSGTLLLTQMEFAERRTSIPERITGRDTPFEVKYFFLDEGQADYVRMAERLREFQMENSSLERKKENNDIPFYLDLYGYIDKIKPFLGIPIERSIPLTTLEDVKRISDILFDGGIENVVVKYNNWVRNASFGKIPVRANFERKLGSAREFSELEEYLETKGGSIYLSSDLINVYETGYGFSRYSDALRSVANTPAFMFRTAYDSAAVDTRMPSWYLLSPRKYEEFFQRYTDNFKKIGTDNMALDNIGSEVYSEMSSNGVSRADIPGIIENTLDIVTSQIPSLMLTGGNYFAIPYADHIVDIPLKSSYYDIIDEHIPFYQITYHGTVNYSTTSSNLSSNPEHVFLKCLETGASPMYSWVGQNSEELFNTMLNYLYSADYRDWIEFAIEEYKEINSVLSRVSGEYITNHEKIKEGVYSTTYGGVLSVTVNYNHYEIDIPDETIEGFGYIVREVGGTDG